MSEQINIENKDGKLVVSSREVAANFEKLHKDVMKAIDNIIKGVSKIGDTPESEGAGGMRKIAHTPQDEELESMLNFEQTPDELDLVKAENSALLGKMFIPSEYRNEQNGQIYREYLMDRDGFSLLVMGFTGTKALEWKLKYIDAFNAMEKKLKEIYEMGYYSQEQVDNLLSKAIESTSVSMSKVMETSLSNVVNLIFDKFTKLMKESNIQQVNFNTQQFPQPKYQKSAFTENKSKQNGKTITDIAKKYNMSATKLNNILELAGVQYKDNGKWEVYPIYQEKKYVIYKFGKTKDGKTFKNMRWSDDGESFIQNLLKERMDLVPIEIEQNNKNKAKVVSLR